MPTNVKSLKEILRSTQNTKNLYFDNLKTNQNLNRSKLEVIQKGFDKIFDFIDKIILQLFEIVLPNPLFEMDKYKFHEQYEDCVEKVDDFLQITFDYLELETSINEIYQLFDESMGKKIKCDIDGFHDAFISELNSDLQKCFRTLESSLKVARDGFKPYFDKSFSISIKSLLHEKQPKDEDEMKSALKTLETKFSDGIDELVACYKMPKELRLKWVKAMTSVNENLEKVIEIFEGFLKK